MYRDVITCATVTAVKVSTLSHSPHDRRRSLPHDVLPRHAVRYSVIISYFDYLTRAYFFHKSSSIKLLSSPFVAAAMIAMI